MQRKPVICLVMATLLEAKPFLKGLSLKRTSSKPFPVYGAGNLVMIISGIGKANAAMATAFACLEFGPRLLVNLGAAGATDTALPPGANLHVSLAVEYDRPGLRSGAPHEHTPDIFRGFPLAAIATLDRPTLEAAGRRRLAKRTQLVDMESAAFIQACRRFGRKGYLFKFVTDTPAHTRGSEIVANIKKYRDRFFDFFIHSVMPRL
ncbi:MAG: hypothetical protein Q7R35_18810 [Elusimicrobiota bacterium]|nr:hypothetical protein [Elusimicrobiota bacterium]